MRIVDTKGQKCPVPIIETRKALKSTENGETFQLVTDSKNSFSNISKFLTDNRIKYSVNEKTGVWTFNITNETGVEINSAPEEYCENPSTGKDPEK